jgi:hypothetical protein
VKPTEERSAQKFTNPEGIELGLASNGWRRDSTPSGSSGIVVGWSLSVGFTYDYSYCSPSGNKEEGLSFEDVDLGSLLPYDEETALGSV